MEKQPQFFTIRHSLQELTLKRIVVHFWNLDDILKRIAEFDLTLTGFDFMFVWQEMVEIKVKEKILKLFLPNPLKRRLNILVRPIGIQIVEWMNFMKEHLGEWRQSFSVLKQLDWTAKGTINYEYTAMKLVYCDTLDMVKCFKLACTFCLVDLLPLVWQLLPKEYKDLFSDDLLDTDAEEYSLNIIELYWAYVLKTEEAKLLEKHPSLFLTAFNSSAISGNRVATQYFFHKLTEIDIEQVLYLTFDELLLNESRKYLSPWDFPVEKCADVLCYLLTQFPPEHQDTFTRIFPCYVFRIFLHWSWHDHLAANADLIWTFLSKERSCQNMLQHIKTKLQYARYYSPKVIQESFRHGPPEFRKLFVDKEILGDKLFPMFLNSDDRETFRLILRSLDYEDRVRLITCRSVVDSFNGIIIMEHGPDVIELCIREAAFSKEDTNRLKEICLGSVCDEDPRRMHEWQRIFNSIDESEERFLRKRKLVFEELAEAKKPST